MNAIQHEIDSLRSKVQTLRDRARVQLHLAGMELQSEFAKLEPHLDRLGDEARDATEVTRQELLRAVHQLEKILEGAAKGAKKAS